MTGNVRIIDTATVPVVPIGPKKTLWRLSLHFSG
ncbi:hypothetical protein ACSFCW_14480 [Yokenella regensburgei]